MTDHIGDANNMVTDEARQRAGELYGSLVAGIDPDNYDGEWTEKVRLAEEYREQDKQLIVAALNREYRRGLRDSLDLYEQWQAGKKTGVFRDLLIRLAQEARR